MFGTRIGRKAKDGSKGGKSVLSPPEKKETDQIPGGVSSATEGDDEMDELQPLDLQRSLSVPILGPKGGHR